MADTGKKPKKFCGTCSWFKETKPFSGECTKYDIETRMESYRFNCKDWSPARSAGMTSKA